MTPLKVKQFADQNIMPTLNVAGNTVLDSFTNSKITIGTRPKFVDSIKHGLSLDSSDLRLGSFAVIGSLKLYPTYLISNGELIKTLRLGTTVDEVSGSSYTIDFDPRKILYKTYHNSDYATSDSSYFDAGFDSLSEDGSFLGYYIYGYPKATFHYGSLNASGVFMHGRIYGDPINTHGAKGIWKSSNWNGSYNLTTLYYRKTLTATEYNSISFGSSFNHAQLIGISGNKLYFCSPNVKSSKTFVMFSVSVADTPVISSALATHNLVDTISDYGDVRTMLSIPSTGDAIVFFKSSTSNGSSLIKMNYISPTKTVTTKAINITTYSDFLEKSRYLYSVGSKAYYLTHTYLYELDKDTLNVASYSLNDESLCLEFGPAYSALPVFSVSEIDSCGNYGERTMTDPRFQRYLLVTPGWTFDLKNKKFVPDVITLSYKPDHNYIRIFPRYLKVSPSSYIFVGNNGTINNVKSLSLHTESNGSTEVGTLRGVSPTMDVVYEP